MSESTDLNPIHFEGTKKTYSNVRIYPSEHQRPGCGTRCKITLNPQQVKTYFVRFLKPIYLNWRIYNFKPIYYV